MMTCLFNESLEGQPPKTLTDVAMSDNALSANRGLKHTAEFKTGFINLTGFEMTIPHITIEQARAMYPRRIDADELFVICNAPIAVKSAWQAAEAFGRKQALEEARDLFSEGFAMLSTNQAREIIGGLLK